MTATKRCSRCRRRKLLERFHHSQETRDGRQNYCRACMLAYNERRRREPDALERDRERTNEKRLRRKGSARAAAMRESRRLAKWLTFGRGTLRHYRATARVHKAYRRLVRQHPWLRCLPPRRTLPDNWTGTVPPRMREGLKGFLRGLFGPDGPALEGSPSPRPQGD